MQTTPRLIVNGTNFNLKNTELYFDPPLQEGTAFSKQVGKTCHVANRMSLLLLPFASPPSLFCGFGVDVRVSLEQHQTIVPASTICVRDTGGLLS